VPSLDTNVLVRFLVADDPSQFRQACGLIKSVIDEQSLWVPTSVIVELEWVLRSLYEFNKDDIIETFVMLLEARELTFQDEGVLEVAVNLYTEHNTDFADCLHLASSFIYEQTPLWTFDRKLSRLPATEHMNVWNDPPS